MTEEAKGESVGERTIVQELSELGRQLSATLRGAWESEERRGLQREISEGLEALGDQVEEAVQSARGSEALQGLKTDIKQAAKTARESEPVQDIRAGLVKGLQEINRGLSRLVASWQAEPADEAEPGEGEASGPDA